MQLGIRLHDMQEMPIMERVQTVKKQGFRCAHLALSKTIRENSVRNSALTPGYAMHLKKIFSDAEIDVAVLGCYMNLATPNEDRLGEILKRYKTKVRFASALGAGIVATQTGAPNEFFMYESACHSKEAFHRFLKNLETVVEYAEHAGVVIGIEPVYRHIVYNGQRAKEVLNAIQSPNLQIVLNPVGLLDPSNYRNQVDILKETIELIGEDIAVIHLSDYKLTASGMRTIPAGSGEMNYEPLMQFMKKEKPYIQVILENTKPDQAVNTREMIQQLYESTQLPPIKEREFRRRFLYV